MYVDLVTGAETRAKEAEKFPVFSGINLLNIKQKVADMLGLIGRNAIFDQYTKHDITHVDKMLKLLDWLIPEKTKDIMSPADWLMLVLSIYFHDLGMLVTTKEFELRGLSEFPQFRDNFLFEGKDGKDYQSKILQKYTDELAVERFLYQEFVRHKHAERIRMWIMGKAPMYLGVSHEAMQEVDRLLSPLNQDFRSDLGLVCQSHHLDDLGDLRKYAISCPYGDSDEETVNLQYAAALLRTADLLHITSDRTPSIAFRIINPTDPLSQEEWAKQMAVKRVRPQFGRNRDGSFDENAPKDTIEVHARFFEEDGFFGLTSYLSYASDQIRKTYDWVRSASRAGGGRYEFPWRYIDDSNIETEGFLRETFEFTIDQAKILDLLTGHTLYNNTDVIIRELVQNSLDAVRLQQFEDSNSGPGRVEIHWNSKERTLSVKDNGTGMTQDIIERHLLKVGSSRYQDPQFKKDHPNFSSISRFGIGVLSTFMVADFVEIITCHPNEDKVRKISLRSVHGKYLIRLLDKQSDEETKSLHPYGTLIKLRIRQSAQIFNIVEAAKKWIVIPNCYVSVAEDSLPPVQIGFLSPKEAVQDVLQTAGLAQSNQRLNDKKIRVEQKEVGGLTIAYALEWSEFFKEWNFLEHEGEQLLGTCVEGVRVEFGTPGFKNKIIVALANMTGSSAPKTNVARSGLEVSEDLNVMLKSIYSIYSDHIKMEIYELYQKRSFSMTWAVSESRFLISPLLRKVNNEVVLNVNQDVSFETMNVGAINGELFIDSLKNLPLLLVELSGQRDVKSPLSVNEEPFFWTIDCALFSAIEKVLREVPSGASLSNLMNVIHKGNFQFPEDLLLCEVDSSHFESKYRPTLREHDIFLDFVFDNREVDKIVVYQDQRRVDLRWAKKTNAPRWYSIEDESLKKSTVVMYQRVRVLRQNVEIEGISDALGIYTTGGIYLFSNSPIAKYLIELLEQAKNNEIYKNSFLTLEQLFLQIGTKIKNISENYLDTVFSGVQGLERSPASFRIYNEIRDIILNNKNKSLYYTQILDRGNDSHRVRLASLFDSIISRGV